MVEFLYHIVSEGASKSSRIFRKSHNFFGIGPEQIAHGALGRDFLFAVDRPDVVH
jgi:hypothetical protein